MFVPNERQPQMKALSNSLRISNHAVHRWRERVESSCRSDQARQSLTRFVQEGRSRPTPRRWMKEVKPAPGLRFIYAADRPGVCVLARDGTAMTVLTRSLCRGGRQPRASAPGRPRGERLAMCTERRRHADWALEEAA
jgi:hypothetical protein